MDNILEYLETAYTGARAINDEESMARMYIWGMGCNALFPN